MCWDWAAVGEITKAVAPIFTAGAACFGVYIAYRGLTKWREETTGKRKADLAEQVLVSFYEARDVFQWVRTGAFMEGEGKTRPSVSGEDEQVQVMRSTYFIPIERLNREKELFAKLQTQRYAFQAYFGNEASGPFGALSKVHRTILATASTLIQLTQYDMADTTVADQRDAMLNTLGWGRSERPDDMDKSIDAAVSAIEALCKPILEGKGA